MADLSNPLVTGTVLRTQETNWWEHGAYAAPAVLASTAASIGNSANWVVQKLGGEGWEAADAANMLSLLDKNAANYYSDNQKGIDTVSVLATAFAGAAPVSVGRTALSGLRFASAESAATGLATRGVGYAFGAGDALESWALSRAAKAVESGATSPFWKGLAVPGEIFSANAPGLAMAAGKGYTFAVEAAASEMLTFSLMHQSSAYEGVNDWSSLSSHLFNTAVFGGALGATAGVLTRNVTAFERLGNKNTTIGGLIKQQEAAVQIATEAAGGAPSLYTFDNAGNRMLSVLDSATPKPSISGSVAPGFETLAADVANSVKASQRTAVQDALIGERGLMKGFAKVEGTDSAPARVMDALLGSQRDLQQQLLMDATEIVPVAGRTGKTGSVLYNPRKGEVTFLEKSGIPPEEELFRAADRAGGSITQNAAGVKLGESNFLRFKNLETFPSEGFIKNAPAQEAEAMWVQGWFEAKQTQLKNLDVATVDPVVLEGLLRQKLLAQQGDVIVATNKLYADKLDMISALEAKGMDAREIAFRINATEEFVIQKDIKKLLAAPHPVSVENVQVNYNSQMANISEWELRGNAQWQQRVSAEQARVDSLLNPIFREVNLPKIDTATIAKLDGDPADVLTSLNAAWGSTLEKLAYAGQQMYTLRNQMAAKLEAQMYHPAKSLRESPDALYAAAVLRNEQLRVPSNVGTVLDPVKGVIRTGAGYRIDLLKDSIAEMQRELSQITHISGRAKRGYGGRVSELTSAIAGANAEIGTLRANLEEYLANGGKEILFKKNPKSSKQLQDQLEILRQPANGAAASPTQAADIAKLEAELKTVLRDEKVWNFAESFGKNSAEINPIRQRIMAAKNQPFKPWADPELVSLDGAMDLHFPATDFKRRQFVGWVRDVNTGEVGMYSAQTQQEFADLTRKYRELFPAEGNYRVYSNPEAKQALQLELEYNQGMAMQRSGVQRAMMRSGHSAEMTVSSTDEWLRDLESYTAREVSALYREGMVLKYGQHITTLDWISKAVSGESAARLVDAGEVIGRLQNSATDKWAKSVKTLLNLNDKESFPLWTAFGETLERYASEGMAAWQTFIHRNKEKLGKGIGWEEAAKIQAEMGVTHAAASPELWANATKYYSGDIKGKVDAVRTFLANSILRWDIFNPVIQTVGAAVVQLPAIASAAKALNVNQYASFGGTKLLGEALIDSVKVLGRTNPTHSYLVRIGAIPESADALRDFLHEAARLANAGTKVEADSALGKAFSYVKANTLDKVGALTDNAEYMVRYTAGYAAMKIGTAAGKTGENLNAFVNLFVQKAAGNYMSAQRPQIFNGFGGATISLFQSYSFNLAQQFAQHIADGNKRYAIAMAATNAGIFGTRSLPFVDMYSDAVLAQKDPSGFTLDNALIQTLGPDAANILQYGPLSNLLHVNLYTRGNATPRSPILIPTNVSDLAMVSYATRTLGALKDGFDKAWSGGPVFFSMGEALAHSQINRPLTGILETAMGVRTSPQGLADARTGPLLWEPHSLSDYTNWETAVRIAGGRPLAEAVQMDAMHRYVAFKAGRQAKIDELAGAARAQKLANGEVDYEALREKYIRFGGTDQAFKRWIASQIHKADSSRVEDFAKKNRKSPWISNYNEIVIGTGDSLLEAPSAKDTSPPSNEGDN